MNMMHSLKGGEFPIYFATISMIQIVPRCCWELFKAYELGLVRTPGALMITGPPDTDVAAVKIQEAEASYPQDGQKTVWIIWAMKKKPWLFRVCRAWYYPIFIVIIISHRKDPYSTSSMVECKLFFSWLIWDPFSGGNQRQAAKVW